MMELHYCVQCSRLRTDPDDYLCEQCRSLEEDSCSTYNDEHAKVERLQAENEQLILALKAIFRSEKLSHADYNYNMDMCTCHWCKGRWSRKTVNKGPYIESHTEDCPIAQGLKVLGIEYEIWEWGREIHE